MTDESPRKKLRLFEDTNKDDGDDDQGRERTLPLPSSLSSPGWRRLELYEDIKPQKPKPVEATLPSPVPAVQAQEALEQPPKPKRSLEAFEKIYRNRGVLDHDR